MQFLRDKYWRYFILISNCYKKLNDRFVFLCSAQRLLLSVYNQGAEIKQAVFCIDVFFNYN